MFKNSQGIKCKNKIYLKKIYFCDLTPLTIYIMMRKNGRSLDTKRCTYQGAQISSTTPLQYERQQGSCTVDLLQ